ncbi:MAG: ParA family protein [Leptolyngbyaceae cyanobacterium SM1_3_5]|nr:ParA family protein [Leptolyngbyaceae cyanobacterium SM1_3_5]
MLTKDWLDQAVSKHRPVYHLDKIGVFVTRILAVFNQAGGVAKTTLTQNLGYQLARRQHHVLLVDMDPQASLTTFMGLVPEELRETVYEAVVEEDPLVIHKDIHQLDLVPTNTDLSVAEMQLVSADLREMRLKSALEAIESDYDFILIDCPPSLGLLSYISLVAATHVLVPVQTQFKAFEGTDNLLNTVARVKTKINRKLAIAGFVPTIYDSRNAQDTRTLGAIQEQLSAIGPIFPPVPRSTAFPDAAEQRLPLLLHSPKHPAVIVLDQIAEAMEGLK